MTGIFTTLSPDWNIPNVKAYTFLATSTDSSLVTFGHNHFPAVDCRERLEQLAKPVHPINWLHQVHGNRVVEMPPKKALWTDTELIEADGAYTLQKRTVCAIITADCLPIIFSNNNGTQVGVVHAGRRGLQNGIIQEMMHTFDASSDEIHVWIGPGIAAKSYPISKEIKEEVLDISLDYEKVFTTGEHGEYFMDLYEVAMMQLANHGVLRNHIGGAAWDTFTDKRFHSARRDKDQSGRMATIVWME